MLYSVLFRFGHIRRWDQCAVYILYSSVKLVLLPNEDYVYFISSLEVHGSGWSLFTLGMAKILKDSVNFPAATYERVTFIRDNPFLTAN